MLRNLSISIYQTLFCLYKVLNVKNVPRVLSTTSTTISTLLLLWILCSKNVMNISFDKICTHLLPASANVWLASPKAVLNASTLLEHSLPSSKWTELISFLPHPPLSADITLSSTNMVSAWPGTMSQGSWYPSPSLLLSGPMSYTSYGCHNIYLTTRWCATPGSDQTRNEKQSTRIPFVPSRGYSYTNLYADVEEYGWTYFFSTPCEYVFALFCGLRLFNYSGAQLPFSHGLWYLLSVKNDSR